MKQIIFLWTNLFTFNDFFEFPFYSRYRHVRHFERLYLLLIISMTKTIVYFRFRTPCTIQCFSPLPEWLMMDDDGWCCCCYSYYFSLVVGCVFSWSRSQCKHLKARMIFPLCEMSVEKLNANITKTCWRKNCFCLESTREKLRSASISVTIPHFASIRIFLINLYATKNLL